MKHLFDHRREIEAAVDGKRLLLMLDFDGTLAPIAPTPAEAELPPETRFELERLVKSDGCTVAVVSGRALGDVRDKVRIDGITYVGNHGLEYVRPNEEPRLLAPPQPGDALERMRESLETSLAPFEGIGIEDKGYSFAVHYRLVKPEERPLVKEAVAEAVRARGSAGSWEIRAGAMVLEVRPPLDCDKGTIVTGLLDLEEHLHGTSERFAMYIGDDATDEDAFKALRGRGVPVLVGAPRISFAEYYLDGPREVRDLLRMLADRYPEAR